MGTRLLATVGALVAVAGFIVAGVAVVWLIKNNGFASEMVLTGYQFKMFAMARAALVAGAIAVAIGVAVAVVGILTRPRVTR